MKKGKMRKGNLTGYFLLTLSCLALILSLSHPNIGICSDQKEAPGDNAGKVIARVNGIPIYEDQITMEVNKKLRKFKNRSLENQPPELANSLRKQALKQIIDQELLNQASRKLVIPDIENQVRAKLVLIKEKLKSEEKFQRYLKAKKLTLESLTTTTRQNIYLNEYFKSRGLADIQVSEEEIKKFYEQGKNNFKKDETVKVSHILISVEKDANPDAKLKARGKALDIKRMLSEGKDFAKIANTYSDCSRTKQVGGDLGYINKRGYMPPEFDQVAFALKKGEVSDVIETRFGYHIIKLVDRQPAGFVPLEQVRDFIGKYLQKGLMREKITAHIQELKQRARIEIFLN
jgi:peptidyl-prolyl cis-trans isomerase C